MAVRLLSAAKTDVGLKRTNNEDNYAVIPSAGLYVLADGMGGHASGQVASTMCVNHVAQYICEMSRQPGFSLSFPVKPELSYEANLLVNAIKYANERVFIQSCKDRSMEGMGTTVTAIFNAPKGLILAHVGDSRIYRVRKGEITQMSRDHSLLNHLIDKGELKPEDAANFANKNVILRAIGLKDDVDVDVKEVPREPGDVYMMCSDGLSDLVSAQAICKTITEARTLNDACAALIDLALKAGGKDNVTVVCVSLVEDEASSQPQSKPARVPQGQSHPVSGARPVANPNLNNGARPPMNGMVGMPPGAVHMGMAVMPPGARPGMPMQVQKPQRMHSVREIVEIRSVPRAMPKPIGVTPRQTSGMPQMISGGSSQSHSAVKAVPTQPAVSLTKLTLSSPQQSNPAPQQQSNPAPQQQSNPAPQQQSNPAPQQQSNPAPQQQSNPDHEDEEIDSDVTMAVPQTFITMPSIAEPESMHQVNPLSNEVKEQLPDTNLLFTAPPTSVKSDLEKASELSDVSDDDDDDDDNRTMIECPTLSDEFLRAHTQTPPSPPESSPAAPEVPSLSAPIQSILSPLALSTAKPVVPPATTANSGNAAPAPKPIDDDDEDSIVIASPASGYSPPLQAIKPPQLDDDGDSIEVSSDLYDDDEDSVTRTFTPSSLRKNW